MLAVAPNAMFDHVVCADPQLEAMVSGDDMVDFERLDESVDWLCEDLSACGVRSGHRVGLCIREGWQFVLALHALMRMDVVIVPLNPLDDEALVAARELDLHYVVSHTLENDLVEDVAALVGERDFAPMFSVADEFTLIGIGDGPVDRSGGFVLGGSERSTWSWPRCVEAVDEVRKGLDLDSQAQVMLCGSCESAAAVMVILACASAGSCLQIASSAVDADTWPGPGTGQTSVLFAPTASVCAFIEQAPQQLWRSLRVALALRDAVPEVVERRYGLVRQCVGNVAIYEAENCPISLRSVS